MLQWIITSLLFNEYPFFHVCCPSPLSSSCNARTIVPAAVVAAAAVAILSLNSWSVLTAKLYQHTQNFYATFSLIILNLDMHTKSKQYQHKTISWACVNLCCSKHWGMIWPQLLGAIYSQRMHLMNNLTKGVYRKQITWSLTNSSAYYISYHIDFVNG